MKEESIVSKPETLYRWVKASERLPEETIGYAKDIVYRIYRDSGTRLFVSTVNQFLDTIKYRVIEKFEWLEPIEDSEQDELWDNFLLEFRNMYKYGEPSLKELTSKYILIKR